MQASDIIFYLAIVLGGLILFIMRPNKPQRPSQLDMKNTNPKKTYFYKQLPSAKAVKAEVMSSKYANDDNTQVQFKKDVTEVTAIQEGQWASPTIMANGKMKDAYAVLGLDPGVPMNQVQAQMALLLKQKNSPSKIDLFKRAYQAIVDADKA